MAFSGETTAGGRGGGKFSESSQLLTSRNKIPKDSFHIAYIIYFTLGTGYLIPWNAFITAVDYFAYLYPDVSVDRIFSVVYMLVGVVCILLIVFYAHVSDAYLRINVGLGLFVVALLVVPVMDVVYVKGEVGLYSGFYVTVGAIAISALGDALVQSGVVGNAGELPERYMQATVAGSAASGITLKLQILNFVVGSELEPFFGIRFGFLFAIGIWVWVYPND